MIPSVTTASVLVVDDHEDIRLLLQEILEEQGYTVFQAANGEEALAQAELISFDLIVTDLIMPEREGIETIRALRQLKPHLKIIAISGAVESYYLQTALLLGADATLRKPLDSSTLLATISRLLARD